MESGAHSFIYLNCHHQIIYAKFILKTYCTPPYTREVWNYSHENIDLIRKAIHGFNWKIPFRNLNPNEMVHFFNKTLKNILTNL